LMLIGGSPGSTAGGIKTTTAFTLFAIMIATFRLKKDPTCFSRRLSSETQRHAVTILMMYLLLFASGSVLLNLIDGIRLIDSAFETASALGTVGLSIGVTDDLGPLSKYVMMLLMFFGRIGGLTVIFAAHAHSRQDSGRSPEERITIG
jgi:potassium uptake protein ktrB